eukprot:Selendium_serpulae@DN735_c0_g1_i1.p1
MAMIAKKCPDIQVYVLDINKERIDAWNSDQLPIFEPGLLEIVKETRGRNLFFSTDCEKHIKDCDIIFVSVNTPPKTHGKGAGAASDLTNWELAGRSIAEHAESHKIIIEKSTVPVRTAEALHQVLHANAVAERRSNPDAPKKSFVILSNPEFLAEGTAIKDLENPDRILIGGPQDTPQGTFSIKTLCDVYKRWVPADKIITTNCWSAELAKLVANAFLAQRITSINAVSMLCDKTGADIEQVELAVGKDNRIGNKFLKSSVGFGGSCFHKDVQNLIYICRSLHLNEVADYWEQVILMNDYSKTRFTNRIIDAMFTTVRNKKICVLGFAYKKNTGDVRGTAAVDVCSKLIEEGALLSIYDPKVKKEDALLEMQYNDVKIHTEHFQSRFNFTASPEEAVKDAHAIVVLTEWDEFAKLDYLKYYKAMKKPAYVFDGRNILDRQRMYEIGFEYYGIGRPAASHMYLSAMQSEPRSNDSPYCLSPP